MNLLRIVWASITDKPLHSFLSVFVFSMSIALIIWIQQIHVSLQHQLLNTSYGVDLVVGAKGSPLQLVLSSVLHIDTPTGNIPYNKAKKIAKNPMISTAIPISYGDNYKGYRILGTTKDYAKLFNAHLQEGNRIEKPMQVILGHTVATELQLQVGDTFFSSHGLLENSIDIHATPLTITGIYAPTNNVIDRLILTNLETIWDIHDHEGHHSHTPHKKEAHLPSHQNDSITTEEPQEITSLLITFRNPRAFLTLPRNINKKTNMQAAIPKYELEKLYQYTGTGIKTITLIAYGILGISCLIIFVNLYRMVKDRSFELALFRTYGAGHWQLIQLILLEGIILALAATMIGVLISQIGIYYLQNSIEQAYKQHIEFSLPITEIALITGMIFLVILIACLFSILPIFKMNISKILNNEN
ncbi:FtsX-like permease family protein [Aquimarina sp. TRL1]|uniref:ABC transporter permease n=1 Tax=Aquimarina sp. (strain TRL1) TaxID=2736252 RepID=UPI00158F591B|nr:FtsX-like permease family protein [Aquimarina sp. TRL1]QKX07030.1 FtsX-like permease family protein [Aquimarina sp. TRL1]